MRLILVALFFWLAALADVLSWAQSTPPLAAPPGAPTRSTALTVTVVDETGKGIPGITVNVAHGGWLGTSHGVDYTGATNGFGVANFNVRLGRYSGEQTFGTTLKIEVIDQVEDKVDRRRTTYDQVTIAYGLRSLQRKLVMLPGGISSDSSAGIPVRVKVIDADGKVVNGAVVSLQSENMDRKREQATNAKGVALLEATVYADVVVTVEASKPNYKSARKRFRLDPRMRSLGIVHEETLELAKLRESETQATLRITVVNSKDKRGVPEARVRFVSLDGSTASFSGRTATDGSATLYSNATGRFRVEVSQDNFEPAQVDVTLNRKDMTLASVQLEEKLKKAGDSEVIVTVLAADKLDGRGRPQPLRGAFVAQGSSGMSTDEAGQARVDFTGQLGAELQVSADGYKPARVSVPGGRYVTSNFTRSVTLQPADPDEKTPIELIVRVVDSVGVDVGVPGVKVRFLASNGGQFAESTTVSNGEAPFTLTAAAAEQARSGLYIETEASGFASSRTEIIADRLKPSKEPLRHVVVLTSTAGAGLAALAAEVARLEQLRADILKDDLRAQAEARVAQKAAQDASWSLAAWQSDIQNFGTAQGASGSAAHREAEVAIFCKAAYDVASDYDRSADRKAREATDLLDAARGEAQRCRGRPAFASADAILRGYQLALGKAGELEFDQRQAQARRAEFNRVVGAVQEKFKSIHYSAMQQAMNAAYAADKEASRLIDGTGPRSQQLAQGKAAADRLLTVLRGGRSLQPQHHAQLTSLKGRIDALLPLPLSGADIEANVAARDARASVEAANRTVGAYSQAGCTRALELYPKVVDKLEQNALAIALALRNMADLPERAQECRAQAVTATNAAAAPPPGHTAPPIAGQQPFPYWQPGTSGPPIAGQQPIGPWPATNPGPPAAGQQPLPAWPAIPPTQPPTAQRPSTSGVPNVVGQSFEQAQAILNRAGLRVSGIERGSRPPTPDWATRIYFQQPPAGSPLPADRNVALKQYASMAESGAVIPSGDGVCLTSEGPFGCTGRFIGQYRLDCARIQPQVGQGTLVLSRDGGAELTMTQAGGPPYSVRGSINAAGTVVLVRQAPREFQRWDGQFRLVAAGGGLRKVQGTGAYQNKFTDEKNAVILQCTGNYAL